MANNGAVALASMNGHLGAVKYLVKDISLSVNDSNEDEQTPLHQSAMEGHTSVCNFLLKRDAKIESLDKYGRTAFLTACLKGQVEVVKLLQEWSSSNETAKDKESNGALALACLSGHYPTIKFLVKNDFSVDEKHQHKRTCLDICAAKGDKSACKLLLKWGADIECNDQHGFTPFLTASANGHVDVLDLLYKMKCNTSATTKRQQEALDLACESEQLAAVKFLLVEVGLKLTEHHQHRCTSLHCRAVDGNKKKCMFLLDRNNAEVDKLDKDQETPFLWAAYFGQVNVMKLLQKWGCNIAAKNKIGNGALGISSMRGHRPVVEFLLKNRVVECEELEKALQLAAKNSHCHVAEILRAEIAANKNNKISRDFGKGDLQEKMEEETKASTVTPSPSLTSQDFDSDKATPAAGSIQKKPLVTSGQTEEGHLAAPAFDRPPPGTPSEDADVPVQLDSKEKETTALEVTPSPSLAHQNSDSGTSTAIAGNIQEKPRVTSGQTEEIHLAAPAFGRPPPRTPSQNAEVQTETVELDPKEKETTAPEASPSPSLARQNSDSGTATAIAGSIQEKRKAASFAVRKESTLCQEKCPPHPATTKRKIRARNKPMKTRCEYAVCHKVYSADWVTCNKCGRSYHSLCAGIESDQNLDFTCGTCA